MMYKNVAKYPTKQFCIQNKIYLFIFCMLCYMIMMIHNIFLATINQGKSFVFPHKTQYALWEKNIRPTICSIYIYAGTKKKTMS